MEKGGKGIKSSIKSASKYGSGKDDNSKNSRKVQFKLVSESNDPAQGFSAKGGKKKESQPPELKIEKELPENAKCLMDCEAFEILDSVKDHMALLSEDPSIKIPVSFDRGLEYLKFGRCYTKPESVRQILEPLRKHGVSQGEMCMIANVCPESSDEVFAFVPSIKGRKDKMSEPLEEALTKLSKLERCT
ncbi:unnamed protein product [Microthlaspi erraticum]|uniref:RNA polymerase Rpb4/RPC9 core domain-containing protein n=1 Tax=Microthlaspi erraticum TaxID=1685480 RepID=A0A6D2K8L1_9BRAS|nr:unnamed protein product [Microthlaspi erraticum]